MQQNRVVGNKYQYCIQDLSQFTHNFYISAAFFLPLAMSHYLPVWFKSINGPITCCFIYWCWRGFFAVAASKYFTSLRLQCAGVHATAQRVNRLTWLMIQFQRQEKQYSPMSRVTQNYSSYNETPLKRSFVYESQPLQHPQVSSQQRPSVLKRSSLAMNQQNPAYDYPSSSKLSFMSQGEPYSMQNSSVHQSNYMVNSAHSIPSRLQQEEKLDKGSAAYKENQHMEKRMREISSKLERTMFLVERHQSILKASESDTISGYWQNCIGLRNAIEEQVKEQLKFKERDWNIQSNLLRGQIESIRIIIKDMPAKAQTSFQMSKVQKNLSESILSMSQGLNKQMKSMEESTKKETESMSRSLEVRMKDLRNNLEEKFKFWEGELKIKREQDTQSSNGSQNQIISAGKGIFLGDPLLLKISSMLTLQKKDKELTIQEKQLTYKVDPEGYLLDNQNRYLLNSHKQRVRLSSEQLQALRAFKMLK